MSYTWEEVMFGIDTSNEAARKAQQKRDIEEKAADESTAAGWWSLGLSVLGGMIFGPPGYFIGKQIGTYGADEGWFGGDYSDWEDMTIDEGKFDVAGAREFNKTLKEAVKDQDQAQVLNTVLDLGKAYVMSGGLTAEPGEWDPTTFGSGEDAWTVFGRGDAGTFATTGTPYIDPTTGAELTPVTPGVSPSADYVPSLWSSDRGLLDNLGQVFTRGSNVYRQDQAVTSLGRLGLDYYESQKEKRAG